VVPQRGADLRPIGRLAHPPFAAPAPDVRDLAAAAADLLAAVAAPRPAAAGPGPRGPGRAASSTAAIEAAALALMNEAPLIVAGTDPFRDLVPISAWSMNVRGRPPDAALARHLAIAERAVPVLRPLAAPAVDALLSGDGPAIDRLLRDRRRAARADGPVRFRRLAAKSAGLRPLALYLDLLPAFAAAGDRAEPWLARLERGRADALLGLSIALFL
jgi:hypothetical protein